MATIFASIASLMQLPPPATAVLRAFPPLAVTSDRQGRGLLHVLATRSAESVELLLSRGAEADATDRMGVTPLMMAADCMQAELGVAVSRVLLARGANASRAATGGNSATRSALDIATRAWRQARARGDASVAGRGRLVSLLRGAVAAESDAGQVMAEAAREAEVEAEVVEEEVGRGEGGDDQGGGDEEAEGGESGGGGGDGGGDGGGAAGDGRFALCNGEGVRWTPEVRLYGAGRGLGQGLSLLGRPFGSEADVESAIEAAKSMAHVLLDIYPDGELEEAEPDLQFEERDEAGGGGCSAGDGAAAPTGRPELDVPRVWQSMLAAPGAPAPSAPSALLERPEAKAAARKTPDTIKAGSKDPKKLRRGPGTPGGGGGPAGAIAG